VDPEYLQYTGVYQDIPGLPLPHNTVHPAAQDAHALPDGSLSLPRADDAAQSKKKIQEG